MSRSIGADRALHWRTRVESGAVLAVAPLVVLGTIAPEAPAEVAYSVYDRLRHIHEAPLKNLRRSLWWIRKTFFTKPRTPTPSFVVERTKPELTRVFGRRHFESGWELSYNYHGEVLNLRRIQYITDANGESSLLR